MKIRLLPAHVEFDQLPNTSMLDSALRAGVKLNYGCSNGACGLCKARKIDGDVVRIHAHDAMLTPRERHQGVILLCSYAAASDVLLEEISDTPPRDIERQQIETKVRKIEALGDATLILHLRTPRSLTFRYHAGQRAELKLQNGIVRRLPVASCPCDPMNLQFHVRASVDPEFFRAVRRLRASDPVTLTGPDGQFMFQDGDARRVVFVAVEDGFAPIKSLMEHALSLELPQRVDLVWFARSNDARYLENYCRSVSDALDNVAYWPATLDPDATPIDADMRGGLAPVLDTLSDPNAVDVYIAGPDHVVASIATLFTTAGVPGARLHREFTARSSPR